MNNQSKNWLEEIDLMRAFGIIAVILIHVTGEGTRLPKNSSAFWVFSIVNNSLQFAVPMFLFISALVLAYKYSEKDENNWFRFYKGRIGQIVLPYIIWTAIYLAYRFTIGHESIKVWLAGSASYKLNFINKVVFFGKGYYHLYFISIIIQFYIVFPLIITLFRLFKNRYKRFFEDSKKNMQVKRLLGIANFALYTLALFSLHYLFIIFNQKFVYFGFKINLFNHIYKFSGFKLTGVLLYSYLMPVGMGMWLGYNLNFWRDIWKFARFLVYPLVVVLGWLAVHLALNPKLFGWQSSALIAVIRAAYVTFASIILYDIANLIKSRSGNMKRFLKNLGGASFGIYLIHPLILNFWNLSQNAILKIKGNALLFSSMKLAAFIAVLGVSWYIVNAYKDLPAGKYLFGSRGSSQGKEARAKA